MKSLLRTAVRSTVFVSILALSVACKNKRAPEPGADAAPTEAEDAPKEATEKAAARDKQANAQDAAPAAEKTLPAPADVAAPPAGAQKSASGLAWTILEPATGEEKPGERDKVQVHYTGWTSDGKMFDSSEVRGEPTTFGVHQVIKGWTEGLQLMKKGEKRRFWIPAELAYGANPRPGAPAGQLTFDVKLLDIVAAPKAPDDVAAPSAGSKTTASGLAYKVLTEGAGASPTAESRVTVHYSGWTKDGKMFDSSVERGHPATFPLSGVIKGWTEGLQLMKKGAKFRFWIPGDLAYGNEPKRPGAPSGQLTFDVELIDFQ
jgi:FKBP-type peptidyl-prolyl cis-trans isomerase